MATTAAITPTAAPETNPAASPSPTATAATGKSRPTGFFAFPGNKASATLKSQLLGNSFIDGIVITVGWADIEPSKGTYDFSAIDDTVALAESAGKQVTLAVFTGKNSYPSWLAAEGVTFWTDGKGTTLIDPTSSVFLDLWKQTIGALGARYDQNESVHMVSMCGPTGTLCGPRFPEFPPGSTFDSLVATWTEIIATYEAAFPTTYLNLEVQSTQGYNADLSDALLSQSDRNRVGPYAEFLSPTAPSLSSPNGVVFAKYASPWCGFQLVSPQGSAISDAILNGFSSFDCPYYEIYPGDIVKFGNLISPLNVGQ